MGLRDWIKGAGQRVFRQLYISPSGEAPKRGTKEFLESYQASPFVQACAGKVGQSVGETTWLIKGLQDQVLADHVMAQTLRRPNPHMTGMDMFKLLQAQLDLVGEVFLIKERNGLGAPVGLYPIPAHWVAETPTATEPSFRLSWKSLNERIPASEVWWAKLSAPADPYGRGAGIAQALSDEVATFEYASKHAEALFINRAMPEVVIMDPGASEVEMDRYEQKWNNRLQGFWRAFRPYFVNQELKFWQPNQQNLDQLMFVPLQKWERDVILQTWGIPPEQFGIVENSNRATAEASDWIYESRVVRPRRTWWAQQMQQFLAPDYDARLRVGYVDTTPADKEYRLSAMKAAPQAITVDEWREAAGLLKLGGEQGKARLVPLNSYLAVDPLDPASRPQAAAGGRPPSEPPSDPAEPADQPGGEAA